MLLRLTCLYFFLTLFVSIASAAEIAWTGGAGDGLWSTPENWKPPRKPASDDTVLLPALGRDCTLRLKTPQQIAHLVLNPTDKKRYTISGSTLTIGKSGSITLQKMNDVGFKENAKQTIECELKFLGDATLANHNHFYLGGESLVLSGNIHSSGTLTLDGHKTGTIDFAADSSTSLLGKIVIRSGRLLTRTAGSFGADSEPTVLAGGQIFAIGNRSSEAIHVVDDSLFTSGIPNGPHVGRVHIADKATLRVDNGGGNTTQLNGAIVGDGQIQITNGGTTLGGEQPNLLSGGWSIGSGSPRLNVTTLAKPDGVPAVSSDLMLTTNAKLLWAGDDQVKDSADVLVDPQASAVEMSMAGHSERLGVLTLEGDLQIDLSNSASIQFADSKLAKWDPQKQLIVTCKSGEPGRIRFGVDGRGVTGPQLATIGFRDPQGRAGLFRAAIDDDGYLRPAARVQAIDSKIDLSPAAFERRTQSYKTQGREKLSLLTLEGKKRVTFFGDSITWQNSYIALIDQAMPKNADVKLINRGINGGGVLSIRDGVEKAAYVNASNKDGRQASFAKVIAQDKSDIAIVFIGINDVWWRDTSATDFENALGDLHQAAAANGTQLILATLAVYRERPDGSNEKDELCDQFAEITRRVARQRKLAVVDLRRAFVDYLRNHNVELRVNGSVDFADTGVLTGDGVHPNQKGNEIIADLMANELAKILH